MINNNRTTTLERTAALTTGGKVNPQNHGRCFSPDCIILVYSRVSHSTLNTVFPKEGDLIRYMMYMLKVNHQNYDQLLPLGCIILLYSSVSYLPLNTCVP